MSVFAEVLVCIAGIMAFTVVPIVIDIRATEKKKRENKKTDDCDASEQDAIDRMLK